LETRGFKENNMAEGPDALRIEKAMSYTGIADTGRALDKAIKEGIVGPDRWVSPFQDAKGKSTIGMYADQPGSSPAPAEEEESGGGGGGGMARAASGGGGGISISVPERPPIPLVYPMITPEYSAPMAQDFSEYMPADSIFGGQNGLLYQPWSQEYLQQYVPQGLINYTPPEINGMMPVYRQNPIGLLDVIAAAEELVGEEGGSGGDNNTTSKTPRPGTREFIEQGLGTGGPGEGMLADRARPAYGYFSFNDFVSDMADRLGGGDPYGGDPGASGVLGANSPAERY